jgi:hypothetical protein
VKKPAALFAAREVYHNGHGEDGRYREKRHRLNKRGKNHRTERKDIAFPEYAAVKRPVELKR